MKWLKSLSLKNFLTTALILFMSYILTGLAFSATLYRYIYQENQRNLVAAMEQTARLISVYRSQWELDDLEMRIAISTAALPTGSALIVTDGAGVVISCSDRALICPHIGCQVPEAVLSAIAEDGASSGIALFEEVYGSKRQYVGLAFTDGAGGGIQGYVILSMDMRSYGELWRSYSGLFVLVAGIVFLIAAIVTFVASRHQTRPINEMAGIAERFGRGELDARVAYAGRRDEIGMLQRSFNAMADSLEQTENSRRELIGNVSHDLKTPITTISGFADGILDGTIPPEKEREYLAIISSEARRMSRMVQNMLSLSRSEAVDPAEILRGSFDICEVMRLCLIGLEGRIEEKELAVSLTLPEEEIITRGDKDAITRVVTNLLDNAVKFADRGSTLTLEIWKQGGKAYVSVADQGETIPPEELPKIFERFHKSDRSRNLDKTGSGLGLFIVKSIINSHREDIFVASENGVTRFVFTLALRQP